MNRFFALFLALTLTLTMGIFPTTAFAANENMNYEEEIDYMDYNFPEDAIVLYQGKDGVIYQSKEESTPQTVTPYNDDYYAGVWIEGGTATQGTMPIKNPHTLTNRTEGTFKLESDYKGSSVRMTLSAGLNILADEGVTPGAGDVRFSFKSNASQLSILYSVYASKKGVGMRAMCWLW